MSGPHFVLHVLPAGIGDALVIDYGDETASHRVVIDGGVRATAPLLAEFLGAGPPIELLVVTHVDNDHIAGMLEVIELLEADGRLPAIGEVWFNGYRHLPESPLEAMGPVEGERLTQWILRSGVPWNAAWTGASEHGAVQIDPSGWPMEVTLDGGLRLVVLSPGHDQLHELRPVWAEAVREAGLDPAVPVVEEPAPVTGGLERMGADVEALAARSTPLDPAPANGSSIAVLAEWAGRSCLLTGDAHAPVLVRALDTWRGPDDPLVVDVHKVAHHGSKANVTADLLRRVRASITVFSSNGAGRSRHPNDEAVARAIVHGPPGTTLAFNYATDRTTPWDDAARKAQYGYRTRYPDGSAHGGLVIDVMTVGDGGG